MEAAWAFKGTIASDGQPRTAGTSSRLCSNSSSRHVDMNIATTSHETQSASSDIAASGATNTLTQPRSQRQQQRQRQRQRHYRRSHCLYLVALALLATTVTQRVEASPWSLRDVHRPPNFEDGKRPPPPPTGQPIHFAHSHATAVAVAAEQQYQQEQQNAASDASSIQGATGTTTTTKTKLRPTNKGKGKAQQTMTPPDAFPYLLDLGVRPKVPFRSGMPRAGESWDEAGLRPNVDPRMPNVRRPRRKGASHHGGSGGRNGGHGDIIGDVAQEGGSSNHSSTEIASNKWVLGSGAHQNPHADDAEAAQMADEWSTPSSASLKSIVSEGKNKITPTLSHWSGQLISSGKNAWRWVKSNTMESEGIALVMLQPKAHRPVIGHPPLIPNDSKRDLVFYIIATIIVFAMLALLWSSRVTPEEFYRAKKAQQNGSLHASHSSELSPIYSGDEDDEGSSEGAQQNWSGIDREGQSRRRRRRAGQPGAQDSAPDRGDDGGDQRRPFEMYEAQRLSSAAAPSREQNASAWLGGWFSRWVPGRSLSPIPRKRRSSGRDGDIALPLLAEHSRSSTPLREVSIWQGPDSSDASGFAAGPSVLHGGGSSNSNSGNTLDHFTQNVGNRSRSGSSSSAAFLFGSKSPLRSLTPQPQTQRQRERERERRRAAAEADSNGAGGSGGSGSGSGDAAFYADPRMLSNVESGRFRPHDGSTAVSSGGPIWSSWAGAAASLVPSRTASAGSNRSRSSLVQAGQEGLWSSAPQQQQQQHQQDDFRASVRAAVAGDATPRGLATVPSQQDRAAAGFDRDMASSSSDSGHGPNGTLNGVHAASNGGSGEHTGDGVSASARWKGKSRDI